VETYDADFEALCALRRLKGLERINANVAGDLNAVDCYGYRYSARMSRRSIDKINRLFDADFDLFGYDRL
jgi:hypothetical protein